MHNIIQSASPTILPSKPLGTPPAAEAVEPAAAAAGSAEQGGRETRIGW